MKRVLVIFTTIVFVLTACGTASEPTMDPANVQGTALAAAMTMVAETQAAIPTATTIPPTAAPSATPFATSTIGPIGLITTPTLGTLAVGVIPTNTTVPASASGDCNQPLTKWDGDSAKMTIKNSTKPKGLVTISLFFNTTMGQCGYIGAQFDNATTISVPMGTFSAGAFVDGKKDFKVFGGDVINRTGNYTLWVENDRIILKAGCAPNC